MTHPKDGEWWCPGRWQGRTENGDKWSGCDGDASCETCHGKTLEATLTNRVEMRSWWARVEHTWQGRSLRGWANLMASRYGRPVYLVGGGLKDAWVRDVDIRIVLSKTEFEERFGKIQPSHSRYSTDLEEMDADRRWHVEIAKMNKQGTSHTHLPIDFQVQPMREGISYVNETRARLDDIPGLVPPWED